MYEYFALKKYMKSKVGFTLVEIMVVIVVMSILVAVGVVIYGAKTDKAEKEVCNTNIDTIYKAIDSCLMTNIYMDGNSSTNSSTDIVQSSANISYIFKNTTDQHFTIRYEEKENLTTHKETSEITVLPNENHITGVYCVFSPYYYGSNKKSIYDSFGGGKSGDEFLVQTLFGNGIPYCPSLIGEGESNGYKVKASEITVRFSLDSDGDPYVSSISCKSHGTITYHAP